MTESLPVPSANGGEAPAIAVHDLHKSFGAQTVLDGIAFEVRPRETLVVLGRSGTGKSVLLKLLIGLQPPDAGSIQIHEQEIAGMPLRALNAIRARMGFLFQEAALYDSLTIEENVAFPLRRHAQNDTGSYRDQVLALLASVGLSEADARKLPSQISGGMKKRAGLARALALNPDILLFDEPTAGLDPITSAEIEDLINTLRRDRSMASVVVTHDLRGAKAIADRVAMLHEGHIVAEGTYDEVRANPHPFVSRFMRESS